MKEPFIRATRSYDSYPYFRLLNFNFFATHIAQRDFPQPKSEPEVF